MIASIDDSQLTGSTTNSAQVPRVYAPLESSTATHMSHQAFITATVWGMQPPIFGRCATSSSASPISAAEFQSDHLWNLGRCTYFPKNTYFGIAGYYHLLQFGGRAHHTKANSPGALTHSKHFPRHYEGHVGT